MPPDEQEGRPGGHTETAYEPVSGAEPGNTRLGVYRRGAPLYRSAGWRGVMRLPPAKKYPPMTGFTGHDGAWPTDEQIAGWINDRPAPVRKH